MHIAIKSNRKESWYFLAEVIAPSIRTYSRKDEPIREPSRSPIQFVEFAQSRNNNKSCIPVGNSVVSN